MTKFNEFYQSICTGAFHISHFRFFHISSSLKLGDVLQWMACHNLIGKFGKYNTDVPYHNWAFRVSEIQYTFLCQARLSCNLHFVFLSMHFKSTRVTIGNSLAVQWLGFHAFTAKGTVSISGQGTKSLQVTVQPKKKESDSYQLYLPEDTCHRQNAKHFTLITVSPHYLGTMESES